jgi:3-polyprenyl-4-hydroxybenzoate decarboxylase
MAVTGASGAPYAVRLLEQLVRAGRDVSLIVSAHGWRLLRLEAGIQDVSALAVRVGAQGWERHVTVYDDGDRGAAPASGSARTSCSSRRTAYGAPDAPVTAITTGGSRRPDVGATVSGVT